MWLDRGPGAKTKGAFKLHLCLGAAGDCSRNREEESDELHTDTLRVIVKVDLQNRVSDWWTTEHAVDDFEAFRKKVLEEGKHAEAASVASAKPPASPTEARESRQPVPRRSPSPRAGRGRKPPSLPRREQRAKADEETPMAGRRRSRSPTRRSHRRDQRSDRSQSNAGKRVPPCSSDSMSSSRASSHDEESVKEERSPSRDDQQGTASGRRYSYGKVIDVSRRNLTGLRGPSPGLAHSRRRKPKRSASDSPSRRSGAPSRKGARARARSDSRPQRRSRGLKPSGDRSPDEKRSSDSRRGGVGSTIRLAEAEDWMGQQLEWIGNSGDEQAPAHRHPRRDTEAIGRDRMQEVRARASAILTLKGALTGVSEVTWRRSCWRWRAQWVITSANIVQRSRPRP